MDGHPTAAPARRLPGGVPSAGQPAGLGLTEISTIVSAPMGSGPSGELARACLSMEAGLALVALKHKPEAQTADDSSARVPAPGTRRTLEHIGHRGSLQRKLHEFVLSHRHRPSFRRCSAITSRS